MRWRICALVLALAPALGSVARAEERGTLSAMFERAADAVARAAAGDDTPGIRSAVSGGALDPWFVGQVLCERGDRGSARALATAMDGPDGAAFRAYVSAFPDGPVDAQVREGLIEAEERMRRADYAGTLAALEALPAPRDAVRRVHRDLLRGQVLRRLVRLRESRDAFEAIARAAEPIGWIRMVAGGYDEAGGSAYSHADYADACVLFQKALPWTERFRDEGFVAGAELDLGNALMRIGEFDRAVAMIERARGRFEKLDRPLGVARAIGNLAVVKNYLRDRVGAVDLEREALRRFEALNDLEGAIISRGNLAMHLYGAGRQGEALDLAETVLPQARDVGRPDLVATLLATLATLYLASGDHDRALAAGREGLEIAKKAGDPRRVARVYSVIAVAHLRREEDTLAEEALAEAERLRQASGDEEGQGLLLANRATVLEHAGDAAGALELLERAVKLLEKSDDSGELAYALQRKAGLILGRDRSTARALLGRAAQAAERAGLLAELASIQGNQALMLNEDGKPKESLALAKKAVDLLDLAATGQSDDLAAELRSLKAAPYEIGLHVAATGGSVADALYFLESQRAGSLRDALGGREALDAAVLTDDLRRLDAVARAREAAAAEAVAVARRERKTDAVRAARAALDAARSDRRGVLDTLQRRSKSAAHVLSTRPATLAAVQAALRPQDALILCGAAYDHALALVVRRTAARIVPLGPTKTLEEACASLDAADRKSATDAPAARLREMFVSPLALGADVKRILVAPEGRLSYVPFSLLWQDHEVVLVPSGTTWLLLAPEKSKRGDGVLALGDPEYRVAGVGSGRARELRPLPWARAEAQAVGTDVLLGAEATEHGLREALARRPRWRALHLACHGLVDEQAPTLSALALTRTEQDDGLWTAMEVLASRVPADLAVLSACETGRGKVVRGEGILGLTRAFLYAGPPRVLVSLWPVDDEAAAALMKPFYAAWTRDVGAARALHDAQVAVRSKKEWSHPFYWAGWTLWGLGD